MSHVICLSSPPPGLPPIPQPNRVPDPTQKPLLFALLDATAAAGITLTESNAVHPTISVSGFYLNHPDSKYSAVGKIRKDQVEDNSLRVEQWVETTEKWLAPYLDYQP